MKTISTEFPAR